MKKMRKILLGLMTIVTCLFISTSVNAGTKKAVELKLNKTYKCDITGDGKVDRLRIKAPKKYDENLIIYVNGKSVFKDYANNYAIYYPELVSMGNKKNFIYMYAEGPGVCISEMLEYKNGRMRKIYDFSDNMYEKGRCGLVTHIETVKNKMIMEYSYFSSFMGGIRMKMVFAYKNGRLKKVSTADTLIKNTKYTARRNVKFYSKIGNNGTGFTLKKGQKVLLDKVRMFRGKLYFRGRFNGKRGWFTYNGKEFISNSNRFFEEVMFVG